MLIDCYPPESIFARVPGLAGQTDPALRHLDHLLDDDRLVQQVPGNLVRRYRLTAVHGRHSTPAGVVLRLLIVQHLYTWSYAETIQRSLTVSCSAGSVGCTLRACQMRTPSCIERRPFSRRPGRSSTSGLLSVAAR